MKYELTHDSIAKQIFEKASTEAHTRRKVEKIIEDAHEAYLDENRKTNMTLEDLDYVKPFLNEVNISIEQVSFLEQQRSRLERRSSIIQGVTLLIMAALAGLTVFSVEQLNKAEKERNQALYQNLTTKALYAFQQNDANSAYRFGMLAFEMFEDSLPARLALQGILDQRDEQVFKPLHNLIAKHEAPIQTLKFSGNGRSVLSTSSDGIAKLSNIFNDEDNKNVRGDNVVLYKELEFIGHEKEIIAAGFTVFGQNAFTISLDNTIRVWSHDGEEMNRLDLGQVQVEDAIISNGLGTLIVTTETGDLILVDVTSSDCKIIQRTSPGNGEVQFASLSPDGKYVLIMYRFKVEVRDLQLKVLKAIDLKWSEISTAAMSPDGRSYVIEYKNQGGGLWDANEKSRGGSMRRRMNDHTGEVNSVSYSADGELILTSSKDGTAGLSSKDGRLITFLKGHKANVNNASFSEDGKYIFTTSDDGTARLWSLRKEEKTMSGYEVELSAILKDSRPGSSIQQAKFSPEGLHGVEWIATSSNDGQVHIWDVKAMERLNITAPDPNTFSDPEHLNTTAVQLANWGEMPIILSPADSLLVQKFENFQAKQNAGLWFLLDDLIYFLLLVFFIVFWTNRKRISFLR